MFESAVPLVHVQNGITADREQREYLDLVEKARGKNVASKLAQMFLAKREPQEEAKP